MSSALPALAWMFGVMLGQKWQCKVSCFKLQTDILIYTNRMGNNVRWNASCVVGLSKTINSILDALLLSIYLHRPSNRYTQRLTSYCNKKQHHRRHRKLHGIPRQSSCIIITGCGACLRSFAAGRATVALSS